MKKKLSLMLAVIMLLQIILPMVTVIWESGMTLISRAESIIFSGDLMCIVNDDENTITIENYVGSDTELIIPSTIDGYTVTSIGSQAFDGASSLKSISIPSSVTSIGDNAFYGCSGLTSIEIPEGVTSIGLQAFYECSSLTSVSIPKGVTNIKTCTFYNCSSLTSVSIPEGVTNIGMGAFANCSSLTNISIPNGVTRIGFGAFENCSGLTSIIIPNSVTEIVSGAFQNCSSLTSISIPSSVTSIGLMVFENCSNLTIYCGSNTTAETYAVENNISYVVDDVDPIITSVEGNLEDWTNSVMLTVNANDALSGLVEEPYSFDGGATWQAENTKTYTENTKGIEIQVRDKANNITTYSEKININNIIKYSINEDQTTITITNYTGDIQELVIPNEIDGYIVSAIGEYAFEDNIILTSILIPNSVTRIEKYAFYGCNNLSNIIIGEENQNYSSVDGILFNKDKTNLIIYPQGKIETQYIIPESVTSIEDMAFYNCSNLASIAIPEKVTSIGNYAFGNCINLENIIIGPNVTSIGNYAFGNCRSLEIIIIGANVTNIGVNAFFLCKDLIICCNKNTAAEEYAKNYDISYILKGDVNNDKVINFMDILAINKHRLGKTELTGIYLEVADVTGDGQVNFMDILQVNKYRLGKINSL